MEQVAFHAPSSKRQSIDEWILDDPEASFLMQMEGNSMQDHGIYHGDMLVVERATEARPNDLVVTVQNGSWAINTYADVMEPSEPLIIQAVVRALIRKYE